MERTKYNLFLVIGIFVFVIFLFFVSWVFFTKNNPAGLADQVLTVTFLDIGQGDASFLEFPTGEQMLIDCAVDARVLEALGRVMKPWDRHIDYLVVTHGDSDHYGGCIDVMKRYRIDHIVYNGYSKEGDAAWYVLKETMAAEGAEYVDVEKEQEWKIGDVRLHFLYPDHSMATDPRIPGVEKTVESNNTTVVIKATFGENDVLFMADAEDVLEEYLVKKYGNLLDVEVLKVGHHGSNSSSIKPFLDIVTPEHASISSGKGNSYGHPTGRVLKRLERAGTKIWRTDLGGDITMEIGRDSIQIKTQQ